MRSLDKVYRFTGVKLQEFFGLTAIKFRKSLPEVHWCIGSNFSRGLAEIYKFTEVMFKESLWLYGS